MRITSSPGSDIAATAPLVEADAGAAAAPAARSSAAAQAEIQSATLQPALAALQDMPSIDAARVAEIRDALARGELPFDPSRLAALVMRYHGSGK